MKDPRERGDGVMLGCVVVLAAMGALTACATDHSPDVGKMIVSACLPMASYSPAQQAQAADELAALPQGSTLAVFVRDYGALRAANRAVCPP